MSSSETLRATARTAFAGMAQEDALRAGATPEEAQQLFQRVLSGAPPEQLRSFADHGIDLANVSPEAFITLLRAQVDGEDRQVLAARNEIQTAIARSRELSERMRVLQAIHQRLSQDKDGRMLMGEATIEVNNRHVTIAEAVVLYGLQDELNLADATEDGTLPEDVALEADSVQSAIDGVRQEQQVVTSNNEMNMITMQQAMQQRGQHIQLVSKVLSMFSETDRAIIGNMR